METEFWSRFLEQLLLVFLPPLAVALTALVVNAVRWAAAKIEDRKWGMLLDIARAVVYAAEQANAAGYIQDKKAYALETAQKLLQKYGVKVDLAAIDAAIESAVYEYLNT